MIDLVVLLDLLFLCNVIEGIEKNVKFNEKKHLKKYFTFVAFSVCVFNYSVGKSVSWSVIFKANRIFACFFYLKLYFFLWILILKCVYLFKSQTHTRDRFR